MLVVGGYLQVSRSSFVDLMPSDEFFTACALLIASGIIVIVVCLFGFIGLWMRSQCIMLTVSRFNKNLTNTILQKSKDNCCIIQEV